MKPHIISGASGFLYGVKALALLQPLEVHLVVSRISDGSERITYM